MIEHNVCFNGAVQSLSAVDEYGQRFTIVVMEIGDYDFGMASRTEEIRVLSV